MALLESQSENPRKELVVYPTLDELAATLHHIAPYDARRFLSKVKEGEPPAWAPELGPCIVWTGHISKEPGKAGYAQFSQTNDLGKPRQALGAHTWLYKTLYGPVPRGYQLDHICHHRDYCPGGDSCPHRSCVIHLEPKTPAENCARSNSPPARNAAKLRCTGRFALRDRKTGEKIGHDLTLAENQYRPPGKNYIGCRPCRLLIMRAHKRGLGKDWLPEEIFVDAATLVR